MQIHAFIPAYLCFKKKILLLMIYCPGKTWSIFTYIIHYNLSDYAKFNLLFIFRMKNVYTFD